MLAIVDHKKLKSKKLFSMIKEISVKSKRKIRLVWFLYRLDKFRCRRFKVGATEKEKTLNATLEETPAVLMEMELEKAQQILKKQYWFLSEVKYRFDSYTVLKNYCKNNFNRDFKNALTARKNQRKGETYLAYLNRRALKDRLDFVFRKPSWKKKIKNTRKKPTLILNG